MSDNSPYAGDVSPRDAWAALSSDPAAQLVDVRTVAEWTYVGVPDLAALGKPLITVEWKQFPAMSVNDRFINSVAAADIKPGAPLYFLCRSGVRSRDAAITMTAGGYGPCFNIATGFEGDHDEEGHRGIVGGWKVEGLPWKQG